MIQTISYIPSKENPYFEAKLLEYQKTITAKSGNSYRYKGIPLGDLRDNMGCDNKDMAPMVMTSKAKSNGVPVRIYAYENKAESPIVFYIHGGGFFGGSVDTVENPCKYLAYKMKGIVVNIDYRLAPETPYPGNIQDCLQAIEGILDDASYVFSRSKVFIAGDSAGGNLAMACLQNMQHVFKGGLLYYPVLDINGYSERWTWNVEDYRGYPDVKVIENASSLKDGKVLLKKLYMQECTDYKNPIVSPIYLDDASILCPLLIQYAEYDFLRAQIESFVERNEKAIEIEAVRYEGICHAFFDLFGIIDQSKISVDKMVEFIKKQL